MHELSIATALVEQLEHLAAEQHAVRITALEVRCGVLRQIVPEAFELAFQIASADTVVAGAVVNLVTEGLRVRCRRCQREFAAEIDNYLCTTCQAADVEVVAGDDIVLQTVTCEVASAAEAADEDQGRGERAEGE
jgi:hydrogenase nickel incorporation protein HypA/HybF